MSIWQTYLKLLIQWQNPTSNKDGRLREWSAGTLFGYQTLHFLGNEVIMLVIQLAKPHEFGRLLLTLKVPRNPVMHYLTQASFVAQDYLSNGWHLVYAYIEEVM